MIIIEIGIQCLTGMGSSRISFSLSVNGCSSSVSSSLNCRLKETLRGFKEDDQGYVPLRVSDNCAGGESSKGTFETVNDTIKNECVLCRKGCYFNLFDSYLRRYVAEMHKYVVMISQ